MRICVGSTLDSSRNACEIERPFDRCEWRFTEWAASLSWLNREAGYHSSIEEFSSRGRRLPIAIRDPVHVFVRLKDQERALLDSEPFQRLRHIHQLATTFLVYPGATHKRFEHSLGVMEVTDRIYAVIRQHLPEDLRKKLTDEELDYWGQVLRLGALCHDLGHLPFSHAAEADLLPEKYRHEHLSRAIIESSLADLWKKMKPPPEPDDIVKVAVGDEYVTDREFTEWDQILAQVITGDAFGADRIDYLLRDSHHAGVGYGRFDHYRLIDTLRILPSPPPPGETEPGPYRLGVEEGGLGAAEALLLARYQIYSQVYFHKTRRILDIHLKEFLESWLPGKKFSTDLKTHLEGNDNQILVALEDATRDPGAPDHELACRLLRRKHFRRVYQKNPRDQKLNPRALYLAYEGLSKAIGPENVRVDPPEPDPKKPGKSKANTLDFPVRIWDGSVVSSLSLSTVLANLPPNDFGFVFVHPDKRIEAGKWLKNNLDDILKSGKGP